MTHAIDIIRAFQEEGEIDDNTMLAALCEFIDGHELVPELQEAFELLIKGDEK